MVLLSILWPSLFSKYPEARALFKRVRVDEPESGEFRSHLIRVINGIDVIVNLLTSPNVLAQHLAHLGEQHELVVGMRKVYFEVGVVSFNAINLVALVFI